MIDDITKQIMYRTEGYKPKTLIILGSGLGSLTDEIQSPIIIDYKDIKGFPQSSVSGHAGKIVVGKLEGKQVLCLQGRIHLYEGHQPQIINTVTKALKSLGIENLIVTNSSGSLNKEMKPGTIMLINDHINLTGINPLTGPDDEKNGPRFPDMSDAYCKEYREKMKKIAARQNIDISEGVYYFYPGPNFETAAEIRAIKTLGADATGMSTVPEVISAIHSGMKVIGLSVITNFATGLKEGSQSHEETLSEGKKATKNLAILIKEFLKEL